MMSLRQNVQSKVIAASLNFLQATDEVMPKIQVPKPIKYARDAFKLMKVLSSYQTAAAVGAATKLELHTFLPTPQSLTDISLFLKMPENAAEVLLNANASAGLIDIKDVKGKRTYVNSQVAMEVFLDTRSPVENRLSVAKGFIDFMNGTWKYWADLPEVLRGNDGHPELKVYNPENPLIGNYVRITNAMLAPAVNELASSLDLSHVNNMLCGMVGISSATAVMKKNPQVNVTVSCLAQLIEHLPEISETYGLPRPPIEVVTNSGDANLDQWGQVEEYDLLFLIRKFAYCGPEHGIEYLEKARKVITSGGYVILWEPFSDNLGMAPWFRDSGAMLDAMLGEPHPLWRKTDVAAAARKAGYQTEIFDCSDGLNSFVIARVP
jgi:hypothetical protein